MFFAGQVKGLADVEGGGAAGATRPPGDFPELATRINVRTLLALSGFLALLGTEQLAAIQRETLAEAP